MERLYEILFSEAMLPYEPLFNFERLWEFWYEEDLDGWFVESIKRLSTPLQFKDMVLGLHTGFTLANSGADTSRFNEIGQRILMQMMIALLKFHGPDLDNEKVQDKDEVILTQALVRQLEMDGYVYRNETLYPAETTVIPEEEEQSYLSSLVNDLRLNSANTINHHLKLSEEHFLEGKWDDSISNSRKVLDAILSEVASAVYLKVNNTPIPQPMLRNATDVRGFLERQNIVTRVEREALDKNYGALSATGGHPYIAEKDQARLMRHLALTFSQFVLLRYEGFVSNNP